MKATKPNYTANRSGSRSLGTLLEGLAGSGIDSKGPSGWHFVRC